MEEVGSVKVEREKVWRVYVVYVGDSKEGGVRGRSFVVLVYGLDLCLVLVRVFSRF